MLFLHAPAFKHTTAGMACEKGPGTQSGAETGC